MGVKFGFKLNNSMVVGPDGGGGDVPSELKTEMNEVFNRKFGTSQIYDPDTWADTVNIMAPLPTKTATGAVVSVDDCAGGYPLVNLEASIVPQQAPGTPTPTNPLPISGVTSGTFTQTKKNLFNPQSTDTEWVNSNGSISNVQTAKSVRFNIEAGKSLALSNANASSGTNILLIAFFDSTNTMLSRNVAYSGEKFKVATAPTNTAFVIASFYTWSESSNQQLEFGSAATTYEAYSAQTATVLFGQTVYGGTWKADEGKVVDEYDSIYFDGSASVSRVLSSGGIYYCVLTESLGGVNGATVISDKFASTASVQAGNCYAGNGGAWLIAVLPDQTITTKEDATHWFVNNPSTFVYPIATPTEISVDAVNLTAQDGVNNIFSDTGDTSVTYYVDINAIMSQLEAQETSTP